MNEIKKLENNVSKVSDNFLIRSTTSTVTRLVHGYFLFKRRKGEIVAGAATFFTLLSFCPTLFLMIALLGYFTGDHLASKTIVLDMLKDNFPSLAPWIVKSISTILDQQLKSTTSFNVFNIVFMGYSLLGLVSTFMYGINTVYKREEKISGFIVDDFKSFFVGAIVVSFLGLIAITSNDFLSALILFNKKSIVPLELQTIMKHDSFGVVSSLLFFTLFYRFSSGGKTTLKTSLYGALTFVSCFIAGKSSYWVYISMTKSELTQSFGNFYTLVIAALWVYFLVCSFFYGASVACVSKNELAMDENKLQKEEKKISLKKVA